MNVNVSVCSLSLLLLLECVRAEPASDLQVSVCVVMLRCLDRTGLHGTDAGCCFNTHPRVCYSRVIHPLTRASLPPLKSLKRMLVEEMNGAAPFHHLSEVEVKEKDAFTDKSLFAAPERRPWDSSEPGNSALAAGKGSILARLLKDLMRTSKRSWSRYKKGGQRSCFGVRLERIGSFSGLGC